MTRFDFFCPSQRCVGAKSPLRTSLVESFSLHKPTMSESTNGCIAVSLNCPHCMISLLLCECCGFLIQDEPQRSFIHCHKCGYLNLLDPKDRKILDSNVTSARPLSHERIRAIQRTINCADYKKKLLQQVETLKKRLSTRPVEQKAGYDSEVVSASQDDLEVENLRKKKRIYGSQGSVKSGSGKKSVDRRKSLKSDYYFGEIEEKLDLDGLTEEKFVSMQLIRSYQMLHELEQESLADADAKWLRSLCQDPMSNNPFDTIQLKALEGLYGLDEKLGLRQSLRFYLKVRTQLLWFRYRAIVLTHYAKLLHDQFKHNNLQDLHHEQSLQWHSKSQLSSATSNVQLDKVQGELVELYEKRMEVAHVKWSKARASLKKILAAINEELSELYHESFNEAVDAPSSESFDAINLQSELPLLAPPSERRAKVTAFGYFKQERQNAEDKSCHAAKCTSKFRYLSLAYMSIVGML